MKKNPLVIRQEHPVFGVNYNVGFTAFTVRRKDFIAGGIQWFERWEMFPGLPPASHALTITGEDKTEEAFFDGIKAGTLSAYWNDPNVALLVRRPRGWTEDMGLRIACEACRHDGEKYGSWLIAAMFASRCFAGKTLDLMSGGRFSHWVENLADGKDAEICSELAAKANAAEPTLAGQGCLRLDPCQITPVMLLGDDAIFERGAVELIGEGPEGGAARVGGIEEVQNAE